ncbi:hypothetical protein IIA28_18780 [candidate division KSB1 bacterium]|nr:hypothetical protein [candidate division KSB1 bacterium]
MKNPSFIRLASVLTSILLGFILTLGCRSRAPENPEISDVNWKIYSNEDMKVSLSYPDIYTVDENRNAHGTLFRYGGHPVLSLRFTDEHQGKKHGLWFGHQPEKSIELGGRNGLKYVYNHYDAIFYMRTISYVVDHQDEYLGLEFRTDNEELDEIQQRILNSLKF